MLAGLKPAEEACLEEQPARDKKRIKDNTPKARSTAFTKVMLSSYSHTLEARTKFAIPMFPEKTF
jgi:hypothetical protein